MRPVPASPARTSPAPSPDAGGPTGDAGTPLAEARSAARLPGPGRDGDRAGAPGNARGPMILRLDAHEYAVATWIRDEDGQPIYQIRLGGMRHAQVAAAVAIRIREEQQLRDA